MPKLFSIGRYVIFFWSSENNEPIHVHIGIVNPSPNATKVWITKSGGCIVAHNKSRISKKDMSHLLHIIQNDHSSICNAWRKHFNIDFIEFYC